MESLRAVYILPILGGYVVHISYILEICNVYIFNIIYKYAVYIIGAREICSVNVYSLNVVVLEANMII